MHCSEIIASAQMDRNTSGAFVQK